MSSSVHLLNPNADVARRNLALQVNLNAALGLQSILKTNLGPLGTQKMLVSGSGELKLTKDGKTLLHEMSIVHPTAALIARSATAQDEFTGDGTTSCVILICELLRQAEKHIVDGVHPKLIVESFELARKESLKFLDGFRILDQNGLGRDRLNSLAKSNLSTKLSPKFAHSLSAEIVDAVLTIKESNGIDLHMVEVMKILCGRTSETSLVKGLVLDHGGRHPDMPKRLENCFIMNLNVSLEYEKTELNSGFYYSSAAHRDQLVKNERAHIDDRLRKIVEFKESVCNSNEKFSFVIVNQKGIDPLSLDVLAKNGILALRRAKRRNAERIMKCCGGYALNSLDSLTPEALGYAGRVVEQTIGEEKYTFIENVKNPQSVTFVIKGPYAHVLNQIADSIKGCLKSVKNAILDKSLVPGAGSFFLSLYKHFLTFEKSIPSEKTRIGIRAFASSLQVIPKALCASAGLDQQEVMSNILEGMNDGRVLGINLSTGSSLDPVVEGIFDDYRSLKQLINSSVVISGNLILVDEIIRAGRSSLKQKP